MKQTLKRWEKHCNNLIFINFLENVTFQNWPTKKEKDWILFCNGLKMGLLVFFLKKSYQKGNMRPERALKANAIE